METIAIAAGRGRRTVYMYFHDKIEIYNAVVAKEISVIVAPLKDILLQEGDTCDTLVWYSSARCKGISDLLRRNPLLLKDFVQSHNRVEKLRESLNDEELRIITNYFKKTLLESGKNIPYEAGDLAITFLNLLRGNDRMLTLPANDEKVKELYAMACNIFLKGIS